MKIYLTGADSINWALKDDYDLLKKELKSKVEFVDEPILADCIHTVYWPSLISIKKSTLAAKYVVAHVPHDVRKMLESTELLQVRQYVDLWVAPSTRAYDLLKKNNFNSVYYPYISNKLFFIDNNNRIINTKTIKDKFGIPDSIFLIGSFQRDTEGSDLTSPKLVKGPDIFAELLKIDFPIHVVLAGPRRQFIKNKLKEYGIPYTFIGTEGLDDKNDLNQNTLSKQTIKELYQVIDLYIVSSRYEGGPKAITECNASKTPIISTNVGHAEDLLYPHQIFQTLEDGIKAIKNAKSSATDFISTKINEVLDPQTVFYSKVGKGKKKIIREKKQSFWYKWKTKPNLFNCHYLTKDEPWGGANQFLKLLFKSIELRGVAVNQSHYGTQFINSYHFIDRYSKRALENNYVVHRIDGPTYLIRGKDKELDDKLFGINRNFADVTIFQSHWSLQKTYELGYYPVNPIVIPNCADSTIFKSKWINLKPNLNNRKIKIIGTSWSANVRKGLNTYKWLDKNLDFTKYEVTFVGNIDGEFENINIIPPKNSVELADELTKHDIYLAPSENDPCSNALIEAMTVGLPVVYLKSGGHPELVSWGGLGFNENEEIVTLLDKISINYSSYVNLLTPPRQNVVLDLYHKVLKLSF